MSQRQKTEKQSSHFLVCKIFYKFGGWIPTKLSWICNWDITKTWLGSGDFDLILKVTVVEKLKIHAGGGRGFGGGGGGGHLFSLKALLLVSFVAITNKSIFMMVPE